MDSFTVLCNDRPHALGSSSRMQRGEASMTPLTTRFRAEFDLETKILLIRVAGRLTDESLTELGEASRKYSTTTGAKMSIVDLSSVTEFALSTELIRQRARQKPSMADPRIVVAPQTYAFGLFRMLQLLREPTCAPLQIVHTLDEVFAALGIPSPHFKPLVVPYRSASHHSNIEAI
jgi:hypothetical protein